ncbi:uncharacterized protein unm_hu7910 isoform X11 [Hemitrygon akajei]|uniref:uncharacterized protein unm_hu7910 isoform X11 n=1 Tax=Hemitrygon akajei TaxID=2704970 RepID=UPI003BF95266
MVSKNKASNSRSSSAGSKKDKHGTNKNGKKGDGPSGSSFFMWFMIIALLGVWSSVAVVWFDLVDYEEVLGKLGIYDADGDGDFDVEDAKILLGLTKGGGSNEQIGTLEEVLDIITEESSDWVYGFLSFLYDVMTPFEILEEENEASEDVPEPGGKVKAKEKAKEKVKEALRELKKVKEKPETKEAKKPKPSRVVEEKSKKSKKEKVELKMVKPKKEKLKLKPKPKPKMEPRKESEKEKTVEVEKAKPKEKSESLQEKVKKLFQKFKVEKNAQVKDEKEPKVLKGKSTNKEKQK